MSKFTDKLTKMVVENPHLPVLPLVDTDVVTGCEFYTCVGRFTDCEIREYAIDEWYGDNTVRFRDDPEDVEDLIEGIAELKYDGSETAYKQAKEYAETLWRRAIFVHIESPEVADEQ